VAVYCRVSDPKQERGASLQTQEDLARAYVAANGWQITAVYQEICSGDELFGRPVLATVRTAVRDGEVDILLCHALDRLTRNQAHLYLLVDELQNHGCALDFTTEDFADTAEGKLMLSVKGFVAEVERLKIIERTQRGLAARLDRGEPPVGARAPFGYIWRQEVGPNNTSRKVGLIKDQKAAPVVARIFAEATTGISLRQIALGLMRDEIPTPAGGVVWTHSTLRGILLNTVYFGDVQAGKRQMVEIRQDGRRRKIQKWRPEDERRVIEGAAEPYISRDRYEVIRERLVRNKLEASRNNRNPTATLLRAGFIRCGYCRRLMSAGQSGHRAGDYVYRCARHNSQHGCSGGTIHAREIDQIVWDYAYRLLTQPDIIEHELERLRTADPTEADMQTIDRAILSLTKNQTRIARSVAVLDDEDAAAPLLAELKTLGGQRKRLENEREGLIQRRASWEMEQARIEVVKAMVRDALPDTIAEADYDDKRRALDALGIMVTLYRVGHEPRWEITTAIAPSPAPPHACADVVGGCACAGAATWASPPAARPAPGSPGTAPATSARSASAGSRCPRWRSGCSSPSSAW
jgi:site-specific DNA recombinase